MSNEVEPQRDANSVAKRIANELGWIDETMTAKVRGGVVTFYLRTCGEVTTVSTTEVFLQSFIGDPAVALAYDFRKKVGGRTKQMMEAPSAQREVLR